MNERLDARREDASQNGYASATRLRMMWVSEPGEAVGPDSGHAGRLRMTWVGELAEVELRKDEVAEARRRRERTRSAEKHASSATPGRPDAFGTTSAAKAAARQ